jgi:hypothetical protein
MGWFMNWDGNKWQDNDPWDSPTNGWSYVPLISLLVFALIGFAGTGYHLLELFV